MTPAKNTAHSPLGKAEMRPDANPFRLTPQDEKALYASFRRLARMRDADDVRASTLLSNVVLELKRLFLLPTRHLLAGEEPATVEAALQILMTDSLLLRRGILRVIEKALARATAPNAPGNAALAAALVHLTTKARLAAAAHLAPADAADLAAELLADARKLARANLAARTMREKELGKALALGDRRSALRFAAEIEADAGPGGTAARLLGSPALDSDEPARHQPSSTAGARPTLATLPLDALEDGHIVPKAIRASLGLATHVLRMSGPIPDAIDGLLAEIALKNGLVEEDFERASRLRRNGAPILFIDELTTLTRKLVYDIWTEERRLAVVLTAAEHPVENPFRTLRIPLLRDHNRQLAHAFAVRTIPTLAEPVVGGMRLTAATGFADLLAQKPVAVPAWMRTFAQMGALRRWCARSWDQTFAEKLASVVTVTADRMPRQQRRRFFENILALIDLPVEEPAALIPVSNLELERLRESRAEFTADLARLRTLVGTKLAKLDEADKKAARRAEKPRTPAGEAQ